MERNCRRAELSEEVLTTMTSDTPSFVTLTRATPKLPAQFLAPVATSPLMPNPPTPRLALRSKRIRRSRHVYMENRRCIYSKCVTEDSAGGFLVLLNGSPDVSMKRSPDVSV
ncbi:hypothetical protein BRADI_4g11605v3 [Brachypodium distachyon]|uniref:Uncharacterized protein n=1 Tax=Brachypodium distachyon TaxID=15368 RepID=A0A2K2CM60_BRADI|nr:hypothetical protein BRADI_4g11605v3 [Brachypodium distachyon]